MRLIGLLGLVALIGCETQLPVVPAPVEVEIGSAPAENPTIEADAGECDNVCQLPKRTLIVGDSEAGCVGRCVFDKDCMSEFRQPGEKIDVDYKGATTIQFWAEGGNFRAALNRNPRPDTIVIFLGTNNYWNADVPNVKPILDEIVARNLRCVWVGPTAVHGKQWAINPLLKAAVEPTCTYVDTEALGIPLSDGVHPTLEGSKKWLKEVWRVK